MDEDLIQDIVRRFLSVSDPQRIIVFGSQARGDSRPDSDVDVLVVDEMRRGSRGGDRLEQRRRLYGALRGCGAAVDVLLYTPEEVAKWASAVNHVVHHALAEGRTVYERP